MGDMGTVGGMPRGDLVKRSADNAESLAGTNPEKMADELIANAAANRTVNGAAGLAKIPLLILSSDDGLAPMSDALAAAVRAAGGRVTTAHVATDHSWSDARLRLQGLVIDWLETLNTP
jgi:hypothetical protein